MPSVEMRRSTRVFVPKAKDTELVRVLRSGRQLWVESGEVKHRGGKDVDEWYPLIDSRSKCKEQQQQQQQKKNGWHEVGPNAGPMEVDEKKRAPESVNRVPDSADESNSEERMFGNVYSRKRNRSHRKSCRVPVDLNGGKGKGDRKFGLRFVRRKIRKLNAFDQKRDDNGLLYIVVEPPCDGFCLFSRFLVSLLRHMSKKEICLVELSAFLLFAPVSPVFASFGVHFLRDHPRTRGFCRIFGAKQFIPSFTVDFSAAPLCFLRLHATMCFSVNSP